MKSIRFLVRLPPALLAVVANKGPPYFADQPRSDYSYNDDADASKEPEVIVSNYPGGQDDWDYHIAEDPNDSERGRNFAG